MQVLSGRTQDALKDCVHRAIMKVATDFKPISKACRIFGVIM